MGKNHNNLESQQSQEFQNIQNRQVIESQIVEFLKKYEMNKHNLSITRGIYIYGEHGSGKSKFVKNILLRAGFDSIWYNSSDIRNKSFFEGLTKNNISNHSVISMFHKQKKPIAIVMDEIDSMMAYDKCGMNILIKLLRPKKTTRQKSEELIYNPIICIGNTKEDKKVKEIKKICPTFHFPSPTTNEIEYILKTYYKIPKQKLTLFASFCQNDLRKINQYMRIYDFNSGLFKSNDSLCISFKSPNSESKDIVKSLFEKQYAMSEYTINENERTIVALLFHENVIQYLQKWTNSLITYTEMLEYFCFSDYVDRVTFQKQIWEFNEITSLLKSCYCAKLFHEFIQQNDYKQPQVNISHIQFTKILTKYSNEFNNSTLINNICENLHLTKNDLYTLFLTFKTYDNEPTNELNEHNISKLEISRIYKFLDYFI